jgi:hypothetical protein
MALLVSASWGSTDLTAEDAGDAQTQSSVEHVASLAAQLLVTKGEYSDAVELVRRNREMSLAADLQRGDTATHDAGHVPSHGRGNSGARV